MTIMLGSVMGTAKTAPSAQQLRRPVRAEPPEDCPVKDRCRKARAKACMDCGAKTRRGKGKTEGEAP